MTNSRNEDKNEACADERERGITNTISALYDANVGDDESFVF